MRGPVVVTVERIVEASAPRLWERHVALPQWTSWHPDVSWVDADAALRAGARFEWVWRGTRARSAVSGFREGELVAWVTETLSGNSTMRWSFVPDGLAGAHGKTIVAVRAALDGDHVLARRPAAARAGLERALVRWIDALATEPRYAVTLG